MCLKRSAHHIGLHFRACLDALSPQRYAGYGVHFHLVIASHMHISACMHCDCVGGVRMQCVYIEHMCQHCSVALDSTAEAHPQPSSEILHSACAQAAEQARPQSTEPGRPARTRRTSPGIRYGLFVVHLCMCSCQEFWPSS